LSFNKHLTQNNCSLNVADDWIQTCVLRCRIHLLYHNHCPSVSQGYTIIFFFPAFGIFPFLFPLDSLSFSCVSHVSFCSCDFLTVFISLSLSLFSCSKSKRGHRDVRGFVPSFSRWKFRSGYLLKVFDGISFISLSVSSCLSSFSLYLSLFHS